MKVNLKHYPVGTYFILNGAIEGIISLDSNKGKIIQYMNSDSGTNIEVYEIRDELIDIEDLRLP